VVDARERADPGDALLWHGRADPSEPESFLEDPESRELLGEGVGPPGVDRGHPECHLLALGGSSHMRRTG
jgi:hypothetical protein